MARYFAQLDNKNIVLQVLVSDTKEWCENTFGGKWVETFMNKAGHNYASIGWTYHKGRNSFIPPKPFPSWVLNNNLHWKAPKDRPNERDLFGWNENKKDWDSHKKES